MFLVSDMICGHKLALVYREARDMDSVAGLLVLARARLPQSDV